MESAPFLKVFNKKELPTFISQFMKDAGLVSDKYEMSLPMQGCELRSPLETLVSNGDFFGKNLENWSPNGLLLRQKSPYPLKFLAFHKKINKI